MVHGRLLMMAGAGSPELSVDTIILRDDHPSAKAPDLAAARYPIFCNGPRMVNPFASSLRRALASFTFAVASPCTEIFVRNHLISAGAISAMGIGILSGIGAGPLRRRLGRGPATISTFVGFCRRFCGVGPVRAGLRPADGTWAVCLYPIRPRRLVGLRAGRDPLVDFWAP